MTLLSTPNRPDVVGIRLERAVHVAVTHVHVQRVARADRAGRRRPIGVQHHARKRVARG